MNTVTGVLAETTTYDRIFSTIKAMEAIMSTKKLTDAAKVTAGMLAEAYRLVSIHIFFIFSRRCCVARRISENCNTYDWNIDKNSRHAHMKELLMRIFLCNGVFLKVSRFCNHRRMTIIGKQMKDFRVSCFNVAPTSKCSALPHAHTNK